MSSFYQMINQLYSYLKCTENVKFKCLGFCAPSFLANEKMKWYTYIIKYNFLLLIRYFTILNSHELILLSIEIEMRIYVIYLFLKNAQLSNIKY